MYYFLKMKKKLLKIINYECNESIYEIFLAVHK